MSARETARAHVDEDHDVITVHTDGEGFRYRRKPCGGCPWRMDNDGTFPAGAFEVSARTAYDMSGHMFGCHESGTERPATCAGFLLKGADHNMAVRMRIAAGHYDPSQVDDGGHELHPGYVSMALANDVEVEALHGCRYSHEEEQA